MSASSTSTSGGLGLFGTIFVVFAVLKIVNVDPVADWSWWWVTAPLWAPALLVIALFVVGLVAAAIFAVLRGVGRGVAKPFKK